jgi:hypothetical protein
MRTSRRRADDEIADIAIETLLLSALEAIGECDRRIVDRDPPRARPSPPATAMPARARIDALAARSGWRRFKLAPRAAQANSRPRSRKRSSACW